MILVVEDHRDTRDAVQRLLRHKGYEVRCAANAEEAIKLLTREIPALIILDEMMPGQSGMELLRDLREDERYREIPVIFYSAGWSPSKRLEAGSLGVRDWVAKGIVGWDQLIEKVGEVVAPDGARRTVQGGTDNECGGSGLRS